MMKSNFVLRTITGVAFVLLLVGGILWSPFSFAILFGVITALTTWEFCTLINRHAGTQVNRFITTVAAEYFFFAVLGFNLNVCGSEIFIPYLITIVYLLISELYFDREKSIYNWAFAMMAQFYVALPFAMLNVLSFVSIPTFGGVPQVAYTSMFTLGIFIFLWASDTGAYCVGSLIGKHRLFPRISPKKSWEGSVGGAVTAVIASQIIATFFTMTYSGTTATEVCDGADLTVGGEVTNRLLWAGLALVVVVFGTWGDLVESLLKRKLGVKDSGNILPGHGGMLDRFDSSLIAIPAAVVYIYTVNSGAMSNVFARISDLF